MRRIVLTTLLLAPVALIPIASAEHDCDGLSLSDHPCVGYYYWDDDLICTGVYYSSAGCVGITAKCTGWQTPRSISFLVWCVGAAT